MQPVKVRARAPLRLGLAGGGTDVSPYCEEHGGVVLNATIDLYVHVTLRRLDEPKIVLAASDQGARIEFSLAPELDLRGGLPLHRGVYNRVVREFCGGKPLAVSVASHSDAPAGSGLGSSSTLVVTLVRSFVELLKLPLGDHDIARLAHDVERVDLALAGGRQDPYAATFGGVNFMEFAGGDKVIVNPLRIANWIRSELEASMILYYTGVSRESARIIGEGQERMRARDPAQIAALHVLRDEAWAMKEGILRGDFGCFAQSMQRGWEAKKNIAAAVTTPDIDRAIATGMAEGAYAAKVSGAGGGGFVMLFADPERRGKVCDALESLRSGAVRPCHFTRHGTQAWRIE